MRGEAKPSGRGLGLAVQGVSSSTQGCPQPQPGHGAVSSCCVEMQFEGIRWKIRLVWRQSGTAEVGLATGGPWSGERNAESSGYPPRKQRAGRDGSDLISSSLMLCLQSLDLQITFRGAS